MHIEEIGLLNMDVLVHRVCLIITFLPRIQQSLDKMRVSWNNHKIRTASNLSPIAIYKLSKEEAITQGYWTSDPGDNRDNVDDLYGCGDML